MTLHRSVSWLTSGPAKVALGVFVTAVVVSTPAPAQTVEWTIVDNPYQEDVEYSVGDTFEPGVVVDGVRWHSFTIVRPSTTPMEDETVSTEVTAIFENRRSKGVKVLTILLLEDAAGAPLERVEISSFKVGGNRMKERKEDVELSGAVIDGTRRAYLYFEIVD